MSCDRLIFNMGIPIPGKDGLYIETGPRILKAYWITTYIYSIVHYYTDCTFDCITWLSYMYASGVGMHMPWV